MKSVLFLCGRFGIGGVERATIVLANEFVRLDWRVSLVAFKYEDRSLLRNLDQSVDIKELSFPAFRLRNLKAIRRILRENEVEYVINQWALPFPLTLMLVFARLGLGGIKLIAVQHNLPNTNKKIADSKSALTRALWRLVSAIDLRLVYSFSDAHLVTSQSFIPIFGRFIGVAHPNKSHAIRYPLTLKCESAAQKENAFIYIGRLECTQKRVDRIINLWRLVSPRLEDWRLDIVGDGPDRAALEKQAEGLPRLRFVGFQDPSSYYAKSKIILLTSDFEGFGLVLVEAMTAKCVPIIYGSYPAAYEIADGTNGLVLPMPYEEKEFAQTMISLACDQDRLNAMAEKAADKGGEFAPDKVVQEYIRLLTGISGSLESVLKRRELRA